MELQYRPHNVVEEFAKGEFYAGKDLFMQTEYFAGAVNGYLLYHVNETEGEEHKIAVAFYDLKHNVIWSVSNAPLQNPEIVRQIQKSINRKAKVEVIRMEYDDFLKRLNGDIDILDNPFEGDEMFQEQKMIKLILLN
jgi:hypothetical protein